MQCQLYYQAELQNCIDGVLIQLLDLPGSLYSTYEYRLTDKFSAVYVGMLEDLTNGLFKIPDEDFPDGFFTAYSGKFTIEVLVDGVPIYMKLAGHYQKAIISMNAGTLTIDTIGETCS